MAGTLAVDVAVSSTGTTALAVAGAIADDQPVPELSFQGSDERVPADGREVTQS